MNKIKSLILNHNYFIILMIKNINKIKNNFIKSKIIIIKYLFSRNILIAINMIVIKK